MYEFFEFLLAISLDSWQYNRHMEFHTLFLEQFSLVPDSHEEKKDLIIHLVAKQVEKMLRYNTEKLMHIAYRIDADEQSFQACFHSSSEQEIAQKVAELFYKREWQKWKNRESNREKY